MVEPLPTTATIHSFLVITSSRVRIQSLPQDEVILAAMYNRRSFEEMGVPPGYGFKQLLFSPVANALVMQTQSAGKNWRPERLHFRHAAADKYHPTGGPGDRYSQEYPFVHASKALLAYNSMRHMFGIDPHGDERHSGDWDALNIFDLAQGAEVDSFTADTLQWPTGISRAWIARIIGFFESALYVQTGLQKGSRMDYFVAELDMSQRIPKPITPLPAVFI